MILEKIKKPNDIHKIPLEDFEPLAAEIIRHIHIRFLPEEKMNLRICDRKVD